MNNCAVRTGMSCVMGAGLGVMFGLFMGTMDGAVRMGAEGLLLRGSCLGQPAVQCYGRLWGKAATWHQGAAWPTATATAGPGL